MLPGFVLRWAAVLSEVSSVESSRDTQLGELNSIAAALPSALSRWDEQCTREGMSGCLCAASEWQYAMQQVCESSAVLCRDGSTHLLPGVQPHCHTR